MTPWRSVDGLGEQIDVVEVAITRRALRAA